MISADAEIIPFVSSASEGNVRCDMLRTGDVIIADTAEDDAVRKATEIINHNNKPIVSGLHTMPCRPNRDFISSFLGYYINSSAYHLQLYPYMQGIKVTSISKSNIGKTMIHFPSYNEQKKIVELFRLIEKKKLIQKRLVESLKLYKRGLLSKVFPQKGESVPQYRFAGFTDAWEQRKLGDTLCGLQNNTLSRAELTYEEGTIKNVHYGDILVKYGEVIDVKNEQLPNVIDNTIAEKYKASFIQNGDVIFADTAEDETVGKCSEIASLTDETALSGLHTIPYKPQLKFATGYLGYYLKRLFQVLCKLKKLT